MCRVRSRRCALDLAHVIETMRPLPIEPLADLPASVLGAAIVRGAAVPVIDVAALLGAGPGRPGRFVTVRVGARMAALAVDAVLGVAPAAALPHHELSPLFGAAAAAALAAMAAVDHELVVVLRSSRLVPDAAWTALGSTR